jgi:hypothetical protein
MSADRRYRPSADKIDPRREKKTTRGSSPWVARIRVVKGGGLPARTPARALQLITISTIDRSVATRQEWHLSLIAATGAGHRMQLARLSLARTPGTPSSATASTHLLARCPAGRTACRRIRQTPAGKKFLLANSKGELLITVATIQNLIHKRHKTFSLFQGKCPLVISVYRATRRLPTPTTSAPYNVSSL